MSQRSTTRCIVVQPVATQHNVQLRTFLSDVPDHVFCGVNDCGLTDTIEVRKRPVGRPHCATVGSLRSCAAAGTCLLAPCGPSLPLYDAGRVGR